MLTSRMIEAFRAVILNGSMSEAAEYLNVSQPAVSRLIKDLETEIGFKLFDRRHGRVFANDDALVFYEEVQRAYIGLDSIARAAEQIRKREASVLRIACLPTIGLSIMPKVIARFMETNPHVNISCQVVRSSTVMQFLTSQQCDIGFVEASFLAPQVNEGPVHHLNCVCVLPPAHRLADEDVITPEHLVNDPFISLGSESGTRFKIDAIFDAAGMERNMRLEIPITNLICFSVLERCGVSIVDPLTADIFKRQGLIVRPFRPTPTFSFRSLSLSRHSDSGHVNAFLDIFSKTLPKEFEVSQSD